MRALAGLIFLAWAAGTSASKILALPLCGAPSHVFIMWKVCKELVERGHEVKVSKGAMHSLSSCILSATWFWVLPFTDRSLSHIYGRV